MSNAFAKFQKDFPETVFWTDSMVVENMNWGIEHNLPGVTTSPTVMSDSIVAEPDLWKELILKKKEKMPEANQNELLWEVMYDLATERSKLMLPFFKKDTSLDGRFCIQGNVYDYMTVDKIIAQSKRIRACGENLVMKIPTTAAGIKAMEEIVYSGISVMATATSTVSQVMAAGAALYRGLERREKEGLSNEGIAIACAMQLGLPEMCYTGYAKEHNLDIPDEALALSSVAVAKKSYHLLLEKYPLVTFVLSNFETECHWLEFMGAHMMLTMSIDWLKKLDDWSDPVEARIDVPVNSDYVEMLREKVPFYHLAYDEEALKPEEFEKFEGFCRTVNIFMDIYEIGLIDVRKMILPDPYKGTEFVTY